MKKKIIEQRPPVLVLGDIHAYSRDPNEYQAARGMAIRSGFSQVIDDVEKHGVQTVVLAGDIFDEPYVELGKERLFINFLAELRRLKAKIIIVPGNHDSIYDKNPYTWFNAFREGGDIVVVDTMKGVETVSGMILCIPWCSRNATNLALDKKYKLVVGHKSVFDKKKYRGLNTEGGIVMDQLVRAKCPVAVFSHFHEKRTFESMEAGSDSKVVSIGSFVANGFDENCSGYVIVKGDQVLYRPLQRDLLYITVTFSEDKLIEFHPTGSLIGTEAFTTHHSSAFTTKEVAYAVLKNIESISIKVRERAIALVVRVENLNKLNRELLSQKLRKIQPYIPHIVKPFIASDELDSGNETISGGFANDLNVTLGRSIVSLFDEYLDKENFSQGVCDEARKLLVKVMNEERSRA